MAFIKFHQLICESISINQDCHLITMCPESMTLLKTWCLKCSTTFDFGKVFQKWTSMAMVMTKHYQENSLIKSYSFKKDRLSNYFRNVMNSEKGIIMKNVKAMREIYEQLTDNEEGDYFPVRLPSLIYLPVFFHIDYIDNVEDGCLQIATIGYHTANQNSYFDAVTVKDL